MNNVVERMWKEAVVTEFKVPSQYFPVELRTTATHSRWPVRGPGFETETNQIRTRSTNRPAGTFRYDVVEQSGFRHVIHVT